jgi:predicted nucleotidyltransferase component of viral defense system
LDSWVFYFQNAGGNRDNIKIEINYSMRSHILPVIEKRTIVEFLVIENAISTLSIPELFGTKVKALIERAAPRDLYDVYNMLIHNIISPAEQDLFRKIVLFYLVVGVKEKITSQIPFDKIKSLKYSQIKTNLTPVLKKGEHFDFETAKNAVIEYLSKLMVLTDSENLFVEKFNQGIYQPELLFNDVEIVNRIQEHPMALWRTMQ